jgi:hypothetical protein
VAEETVKSLLCCVLGQLKTTLTSSGKEPATFTYIYECTVMVKIIELEIYADFQFSDPLSQNVKIFWTIVCVSAPPWARERLNGFNSCSVFQQFIHRRLVPGECEQMSPQNRGHPEAPPSKHKIATFLKMGSSIFI